MASNQICSVDNKQIEIYNENENENEEDDDEEEENSEINCRTEIGEANLVQCKQAQIGNRSDYYGPVKVRTLYKITVPKSHNNTALSGHGSPINFARPFDNSIIGPSTSRETFVPVTASEMARATLGNRRHLSEDTTESDPNSISTNDISDQTPLVTGVNKSKAKQIVCLTAAILGILIMIIILIIEIILYYQINPSSGDDNLPMNFTERLVTRGEWFAFQPKHDLIEFNIHPIPFVVVSHTAGSPCYDQPSCRAIVRNIQGSEMQRNYDDIAYNYLVGGDGYIYEGRTWNYTSAVNRKVRCSALFIAFIGMFNVQLPPLKQMDAFKLVLEKGVEIGTLDQNYKMFMQKQISNMESPGAALINVLIKWPHWKPFNKEDLLCDKNVTLTQ